MCSHTYFNMLRNRFPQYDFGSYWFLLVVAWSYIEKQSPHRKAESLTGSCKTLGELKVGNGSSVEADIVSVRMARQEVQTSGENSGPEGSYSEQSEGKPRGSDWEFRYLKCDFSLELKSLGEKKWGA